MKAIALFLLISPVVVGQTPQAPATQPAAAELSAQDILKAARAALGGGEPKSVQSMAIWGNYRRGPQASVMALSLDLSGRFLEEHTTYSNSGEVQRMGMSDDGPAQVGGGMPGDSGGPALNANVTECLNGDSYWSKTGVGGSATTGNDARKNNLRRIFARYALAFTLTAPQNYPVTFAYLGRVESPDGMVDAVEGKGPEGFQVRVFLDIKTHLPMMIQYVSAMQGVQEVQFWLKDYKAEEGLLVPHTLLWFNNARLTEEFQVQRVKLNPKFKAEKFQK